MSKINIYLFWQKLSDNRSGFSKILLLQEKSYYIYTEVGIKLKKKWRFEYV